MTSWFRSWHGAPTDMKWRTIAKRAGVPSGYVTAIVWTLLDRASQADERGSIAGYDAEEIAVALDFEPEQVEAVIAAMRDKGVLDGDTFTGWAKHQPGREDGSAERAKAWREREKTQANAGERTKTPREDTDTDTERGERAGARGRPPRKYPLELDWEPSPETVERCNALGLTREEISAQLVVFGTWHRSRGEERADWDEAFALWCQREAKKLDRKPGKPPPPRETVYVRQLDDAWPVYAEAWKSRKGRSPPTDRDGGWHFPADLLEATTSH